MTAFKNLGIVPQNVKNWGINMKRSEQKARTKYNIRQAFIDLLQKKEMDNITITELAKSANIDRKTFYLHYDTTFDVYHDIIDDVSNQLDDILKQQNDFDFFIFFNELNQVMQANFKFYQTIAKQKSYAYLIKNFTDILENGLTHYYLSSNQTTSNKIKIRYISNGIMGVYINWLAQPNNISQDELVHILSDLLENDIKHLNN
ncbi:TetR/AcrR family transcriptional regulator [Streptococcus gallolyticus]|uniref:TetR/AcrR family transcriptional regulator n=1 Tax=Streptococcus gallolyticus TaxID=315405 RepID=UPI0002DFAC74|nr:TetR-like C-terminal domain-containing protein [Streptococcus gallolyticus]